MERAGGVLAGSHYFSRSEAYASILHARAEAECEGQADSFEEGYLRVFGALGLEGRGVREARELPGALVGVKPEVDEALAGRGSAQGVTMEAVYRSWYWLA